jgi:hypothetical protein
LAWDELPFLWQYGHEDTIGIYELLQMTPEIKRLIVGTQGKPRCLALTLGTRTLREEAIKLVAGHDDNFRGHTQYLGSVTRIWRSAT